MNTSLFIRLILLILLALPLPLLEVSAQIIDEKEVVPAVMDIYNRRFRKATEPVWEMKGNDYGVSFLFKGKRNYAEIDRSGKLTMQRTEVLLTELRPNTQAHLKKKYRSQVMRKAEYVQELPNKKYYYVEMVPRRQKDDEDATVTKVYFSSTGLFQSEGEPLADSAEEVKDKLNIPPAVMKEFNKRVKKSSSVDWMNVDTAFRADYKSGNNDAFTIISYDGTWLLTSVKLKAKFKSLHPGIQRYFNENMGPFSFQYAEDVSIPPNEKYFNVVILDKSDEPPIGGELLPTQLHFAKSGKYIATIYPDYDVDPIKESEDKKWDKTASDSKVADASAGMGEKNINRKDLPSKAQQYLLQNYNHEWRTPICRAIEDEHYGILYYVVMKKQGVDLQYEHYFDLNGNLLEDEKE